MRISLTKRPWKNYQYHKLPREEDLTSMRTIDAFAYGVKLSNHCEKLLNSAEDKINKILNKEHVDDSKKLKSEDIFD